MTPLNDILAHIVGLFDTRDNPEFASESGITYDAGRPIATVGYATNLTPEVVDEAHALGVDLLVTHHDAWDFVYGLKDRSREHLAACRISHYYCHLPLDDAPFGTNAAIANALGLRTISRECPDSGFSCGLFGEYPEGEAPSFEEFVASVSGILDEPVSAWRFGSDRIRRVFILCGAGHLTTDMKVAVERGADVYLTGEKILYSLEYAKLSGMNLVVGSHAFVELPGVCGLCARIGEGFPDLRIVEVPEAHLEADGFPRQVPD